MKQKLLIIALLALVLMAMLPVQAQHLTITNSKGNSLRDINVYFPNATTGQMDLYGRFNTSSIITTDGNVSYTLDLVPMETNPLTDPTDWLVNGVFPFLTSNVIAILLLVFIIVRR